MSGIKKTETDFSEAFSGNAFSWKKDFIIPKTYYKPVNYTDKERAYIEAAEKVDEEAFWKEFKPLIKRIEEDLVFRERLCDLLISLDEENNWEIFDDIRMEDW